MTTTVIIWKLVPQHLLQLTWRRPTSSCSRVHREENKTMSSKLFSCSASLDHFCSSSRSNFSFTLLNELRFSSSWPRCSLPSTYIFIRAADNLMCSTISLSNVIHIHSDADWPSCPEQFGVQSLGRRCLLCKLGECGNRSADLLTKTLSLPFLNFPESQKFVMFLLKGKARFQTLTKSFFFLVKFNCKLLKKKTP